MFACQAKNEAAENHRQLPGDTTAVVSDSSGREETADTPIFSVAGITREEARALFDELKQAVKDENKEKLAQLINYPLKVELAGEATLMRSPEEFIANYPDIINDRVKRAVLEQQFSDLFVNWQGVRIGRGEIWFAGVGTEDTSQPEGKGYEVRIIAINNVW